jgi:outer membrane protein
MKKTCLSGLLVALAAAATASAQEGRPARVAVVDTTRISSESLMGKDYAAQLEKLSTGIQALRTQKQADLGKLDTAIKALEDEIQKQGAVLSDEAREKKQQELTRKNRERAAFLEDGQAEISRETERAQQKAQAINAEFQGKIRPLVEQVAQEKGVDIVIEATVTVWADRTQDITAAVIAKSDALEKAKPAAAATAPTAKPPVAPKP